MTPAERARYAELAARFNRDRRIEGQELGEYTLLYFATRGDDSALAEYRAYYGTGAQGPAEVACQPESC